MSINRHNYEEFFILYLDNELSSPDRSMVELFVQENPDLAEELALLQQTMLVADTTVTFEGKEELMRSANEQSITQHNYEEWLVLYTDNELTMVQRTAVEQFAAAHPAVQEELDLLQHTRFQPEEQIVFPFKDTLYRKEETAKVVTIHWRKIAVAAAVLFAVSISGIVIYKNNNSAVSGPGLAAGGKSVITPATGASQPGTRPVESPAVAINTDVPEVRSAEKQETVIPAAATRNAIAVVPKKVSPDVIKQDEPLVATDGNRNNLPAPVRNPNMKEQSVQNGALAALTPKETLTDLQKNTPPSTVTPGVVLAYKPIDTPEENQPDKKSHFRGLLRKITRTIEKTTNIKATDDDDRLLVGALAIRL